MDENEIIFIDDEERNARPGDHRTQSGGTRAVVVPRRPQGRPPVVIRTSGSREPIVIRDPQVITTAPAAPGDKRLLGNITLAEAAELLGEVLGASASLPMPPVATGKVDVDVENLTLFHNAVATHFKRDERIRLVGSLLAKLLS
jgi:hypothetical protein